jgi:hypothetical protein
MKRPDAAVTGVARSDVGQVQLSAVTWLLVQGAEVATQVWSALQLWGLPREPDPAFLGERWWLLAQEIALPLHEDVMTALRGAQAALVLTQDDPDRWNVWLRDGQREQTVPVDPAGPIDPVIHAFSDRRPPRRVRPRLREKPENPLPLRDPGAAWLTRVGWPIHRGMDPLLVLAECDGWFGHSPVHWSAWLGEQRWCNRNLHRWVIAAGDDFYGLWDRDNPDQVLQRWPRTPEGMTSAREAADRLIFDPIVKATHLAGERYWATAPGLTTPDPGNQCGAVIAHWHPRGTVSTIEPWTRQPLTRWRSPVGRITLVGAAADRYDPAIGRQLTLDVALDSCETALRVARAMIVTKGAGPWQRVPDDVPRDLLTTCDWVRTQASRA